MSFVVKPMPQQLPAALVEKLARVETATVGHWRFWGFMDRRIQGVLPGRRVAGTAVTVQTPGQDSSIVHYALGLIRPGDVLVVDRLGDDRHACVGGGVALAAKLAGAAAIVVDGPATDFSEIVEVDMPVWCRGPTPITTRGYALGGSLNRTIACGGVAVSPGDAVICDESGVLILPPDEAEAEAEAALARQAKEKGETWPRLRKGEKLPAMSGATAKIDAALAKK